MLILLLGCSRKTITKSSLDFDGRVFTTPPQLMCTNTATGEPKFVKGGALTGGRSRASLMRGMMSIMGELRKLYNEEYPDSCKPVLKVVAFFKVDYSGKVASAEVSKTNSGNPKFDSVILDIVKSIKFDRMDLINDITEVIYPLCFSR